MTELFAVLEYQAADYEGGGHELYGIFSTQEKAEAYVKKLWKDFGYPEKACVPDSVGNYVISNRYDTHHFCIDKVILDEEQ